METSCYGGFKFVHTIRNNLSTNTRITVLIDRCEFYLQKTNQGRSN